MEKRLYDMLVVGGGPAGYAAALYAARAGLDVLVLEKLLPGGQLTTAHCVSNYPGLGEALSGDRLGTRMQEDAHRFGAKTETAEAVSVALRDPVKSVETPRKRFYGRTAVIATGASPRTLHVPGEASWRGNGVHFCAVCNGIFYRGKTVVVVGGGNSAVAEALFLSRIAAQVILVYRGDCLRAENIGRASLESTENVTCVGECTVVEIVGDTHLTGVVLRDGRSGEQKTVQCDGVFISIGREPASSLVRDQLALDQNGYVVANETTCTEIPGVFAVGDVRTKIVRQIVTAVADGATAVHFAEMYLENSKNAKKDP